MIRPDDIVYMRCAIALARSGYGYVNPNPLVGALIVKGAEVVAQGAHLLYGHEHAERNALNDAASKHCDVRGSTMYVTLEPCSHHGHQPPCADALVDAGISRVVIGSLDPNPKVDGRGIQKLMDGRIDVEVMGSEGSGGIDGQVREECENLNASFFYFIRNNRPYIIHKYAMSLDGKIATHLLAPTAISGQESHRQVQLARSQVSAVITGIGTVLSDNPRLTVRVSDMPVGCSLHRAPHQPLRVVVDSQLRIPLDSNLVKESSIDGLTVIAANKGADSGKVEALRSAGCEVLLLGADDAPYSEFVEHGRAEHEFVDVEELIDVLAQRGVDSVMLECGGKLAASFYEHCLVNHVQIYCAPILLGGQSPTPFDGLGFDSPDDAPRLVHCRVIRVDDIADGDILIEGDVEYVHRTH